MGKICSVKVLIKGIYENGGGFVSDEAVRAYYNFWNVYIPKCNTYHVGIQEEFFGNSIYLYGLHGRLNVHPAEIAGILETSNSAKTEEFQSELRDLDVILRDFRAYMEVFTGLEIGYKILYAVIDTPKELLDISKREYRE